MDVKFLLTQNGKKNSIAPFMGDYSRIYEKFGCANTCLHNLNILRVFEGEVFEKKLKPENAGKSTLEAIKAGVLLPNMAIIPSWDRLFDFYQMEHKKAKYIRLDELEEGGWYITKLYREDLWFSHKVKTKATRFTHFVLVEFDNGGKTLRAVDPLKTKESGYSNTLRHWLKGHKKKVDQVDLLLV